MPYTPALLATAVVLMAGCHAHAPLPYDAAEPGLEVRVHLTRPGVLSAEEQIGHASARVEGRILQRDDDNLLLRVALPTPDWDRGGIDNGLHQRLVLARDVIVAVERRELDRTRTSALITGAAAALAILIRHAIRVRDPGGVVDPPRNGGEL